VGKYQSHGKDPSIAPDKQRKGSKSFKSNCPYKARKTTLPLLIIIKALECDLESQIHRWARGDDELTLSQLDFNNIFSFNTLSLSLYIYA
jgi:hypothetical protein